MFVTLAPKAPPRRRRASASSLSTRPRKGSCASPGTWPARVFGKPKSITPASEFAYPRGIVYDAVSDRLLVCDAFNDDRSKVANQIAVVDSRSGQILSRFGKPGGVDPATGGAISGDVFTCPLTIEADSQGALWVNDYYTGEVREVRVRAGRQPVPARTSRARPEHDQHVPLLLGAGRPGHRGVDGRRLFRPARGRRRCRRPIRQPARHLGHVQPLQGRAAPFAHFSRIGDHVYATFAGEDSIYEQSGDGLGASLCLWQRRRGRRRPGGVARPGRRAAHRPGQGHRRLRRRRLGEACVGVVRSRRRRQNGMLSRQSRV